MMKLGFSIKPGWCSPDDVEPFLDFLADAGVGAVELTLSSSGAFERRVAKAAIERGLKITFHMVWDTEAIWRWYRGWNTEAGRTRLDRFLASLDEWAAQQGEPVPVVIHPFDDSHDRKHGLGVTLDFCRRLVERTGEQSCRIKWVIENMPHDPNVPSRAGDCLEEIEKIVREVPGLGICWDIGHWHLTRTMPKDVELMLEGMVPYHHLIAPKFNLVWDEVDRFKGVCEANVPGVYRVRAMSKSAVEVYAVCTP